MKYAIVLTLDQISLIKKHLNDAAAHDRDKAMENADQGLDNLAEMHHDEYMKKVQLLNEINNQMVCQ